MYSMVFSERLGDGLGQERGEIDCSIWVLINFCVRSAGGVAAILHSGSGVAESRVLLCLDVLCDVLLVFVLEDCSFDVQDGRCCMARGYCFLVSGVLCGAWG